MQSIAIASILVAATTLTAAAPTVQRRTDTKFYTCANNGFTGQCSVDPCAISWCPDYKPGTYESAKPVQKLWYVCASNGFRGECSVDPCALPWCPDAPKPVETKPAEPLYYVCASNGFKGLCSVDPCALPWCPDVPPKPVEPVKPVEPAPAAKQHYVCASNGFNGDCSVNACNVAWCPDYEYRTYKPVVKTTKRSDPTVCAPGTGYFQSCSNGFRGCCKSDACGSKTQWCPDYKPWTFEPATAAPQTETVPKVENTPVSVPADCAAGTGFYQVCGNGFKGCCKYDACTLGYCPSN